MTFNCRFETPCGMCELFERPCKEVCDKKNEVKSHMSPMDLIKIHKLPTHNIKTGELEY